MIKRYINLRLGLPHCTLYFEVGASLKNVGRYHSGLVSAAQHVNFTWFIVYSMLQILVVTTGRHLFGIVRKKGKENLGESLGRGAVPPPQNNNVIMRITAFMPL